MSMTPSDYWQHRLPTPTFVHVRQHPREFSADFPHADDTLTTSSAAAYTYLPRVYPGQDDSGQPPPCVFPPPPCQGPDCAATPFPPCIPFSSHHPPTSTPTFSSFPTTGTQYSSSTTRGTSTTTSTSSVLSTGTSIPAADPQTHDPVHPLTAVQIAGIALGGALGVLFLGVFLWLFRRGTFGSGTLFGLMYGDARHAGRRPDLGEGNVGAEMSQTGKRTGSAGDLRSPFADPPASLPSYASSTLAASVVSLPVVPDAKLHHAPSLPSSISQAAGPPPPPRSPAAWSTSPSAFDNAYGSIVAGCPSTTASARSRATTLDALSDVSTLVSGRMRTPQSTRTSSAYVPRLSTSTSGVALALERDLSAASTQVEVTTRTPSPASTSSVGSMIEGVRISSWHSSDSEETRLIVRR
ncbi:hypothetical protein OH76DRAFT_195279 [Lentinus brumalis]|uniref:Uncharacterized protein n=1 Tax=Lentinus brumalis TaxID=2498619 RepID=A0A371DI00_9APHY|nr:hypothetical protein OH76DRAFT_195279 [Polyporus brumalis]